MADVSKPLRGLFSVPDLGDTGLSVIEKDGYSERGKKREEKGEGVRKKRDLLLLFELLLFVCLSFCVSFCVSLSLSLALSRSLSLFQMFSDYSFG